MIPVRCPTCDKRLQIAALEDLPSFPFCSERCRLVDLGRWLSGEHAIPGPPASDDEPTDPAAPAAGSNGKHPE